MKLNPLELITIVTRNQFEISTRRTEHSKSEFNAANFEISKWTFPFS